MSTRRPPVVPRPSVDVSRAASLPPLSAESLHRRRLSVSSAYNGPVRATVQRYTSPAPPASLPTIRQGELGSTGTGYRRASYSGASPNYRTNFSTSFSRHTTPDRSALDCYLDSVKHDAGKLDISATLLLAGAL